jgi:cell wall-associated NlpC family hydrolase
VYSPDVQVIIATKNNVQYDISADIVRGGLVRKENSVSSFSVTLANKQGRYNGLLSRMDRITVKMKRTQWVTVFTGYLDSVPYKQMFPGEVTITASCTLKKLMHTWWNPSLKASQDFFSQGTSQELVAGDGQSIADAGLGNLLANLLSKVGGLSRSQIHIQNFPMTFLTFLLGAFQKDQSYNQAQSEKFKQMLLGDDHSSGAGPDSSHTNLGTASGGAGGQQIFGVGEQGYVTAIVKACDDRRLGPVTADIQTSQSVGDTGETLQAANDRATQVGGHDFGSISQNQQTQERDSDAAILGVACAMAETGGGTTIRNLCNPAVPASMSILPNDGPGTDGTSCGIFQQIDGGSYGSVAQRMDPYQAATMFFRDLVALGDWRNMDAATAIHRVQRNGTGTSPYETALPQARTLVQGIRSAQGAYTPPGTPGVLGPSAIFGMAAASVPGANGALTSGNIAAPGGIPGAPTAGLSNLEYDSEGAINCAMAQLGKPYEWGGQGPGSFDCAGLVHFAFKSIGLEVGQGTTNQHTFGTSIPASAIQRGDVIQPHSTHTQIWLGDGTVIEAYQTGSPVSVRPYTDVWPPYSIQRMCPNSGRNPSAPFNPASGPGSYPGSSGTQGASGATGGGDHREPIARNLFGYQFEPAHFASAIADLFTGDKCFMEDQPLIQMVQTVCKAGLRNFQSAPNGDFIAYYPDYFGLDGHPTNMIIENIEMIDVHIELSDDNLATHVYVAGDRNQQGLSPSVLGWLNSAGVATVENQALFARLCLAAPGSVDNLSGSELLRRFGVRPYMKEYSMAGTPELEFLIACQVFAEKWAEQYLTTIKLTFMPELFPGMRIQLSTLNLVVYVARVTHTFDFEEGAGFSTDIEIMAPSNVGVALAIESVLPTVPTNLRVDQISSSVIGI